MMQIVPRWKITLSGSLGQIAMFWISDNHIENVLRQVAAIQFKDKDDTLNQPTHVFIEKETK